MLISYLRLTELLTTGVIDADLKNVNSSSIDITLGEELLIEVEPKSHGLSELIDISAPNQNINTMKWIGQKGEAYILEPGQCVLGSSVETFNLPDTISAEYKLKSSMARNFLEHLNAGWCDAGWHGSKLTLELKNLCQYHALVLRPGMKIGQVVFFEHKEVPSEFSYAKRGQYNGDRGVQKSRGVK